MAYSAQTKIALRAAYVHKCQPLEAAAKELGVTEGTARRWKTQARKQGDDWDKARGASLMAGQGQADVLHDVLQRLVTLTQSTLSALQKENIDPLTRVEAISRLSDAYHKTAAAAGKTNPKMSKLAVAMDVLERLAAFTAQHTPHHMEVLAEILEPFGAELARSLT